MHSKLSFSENWVIFWGSFCGINSKKGIQVFNCCYLKKLGFRLNHGTRVYAFAYNNGRLENVQTSKDDLYHFLLVVFT